ANVKAIEDSITALHKVDVPESWLKTELPLKATAHFSGTDARQKYVFKIVNTVNAQEGDSLSVGDLIDNNMQTGDMPVGTTAFEKRGIALQVPEWNADRCTQCNECAFVCPHAAIRPFLAEDDELTDAPEGFIVKEMRGVEGLKYRIQVSVEDCTGCGLCVAACPAKGKALELKSYEAMKEEAMNWAFAMTLRQKENPAKPGTLLHYQFNKPLIEFSGACAGCGETPYIKLLTQMYGDRMVMANATGCSSIYGGSAPVTPYTTNALGQGPAWSNSLFEDNAEFGYGIYIASKQKRDHLAKQIAEVIQKREISTELAQLLEDWIIHKDQSDGTRQRAEKLKAALAEELPFSEDLQAINQKKDLLVKPSQWIIGGDGWAYDIGYGGIDHVIASGADVNILVMDNEVYANTGGQVSKATPMSAVAKFAANGKFAAKKDLGMMAMTYGNVYVAQIASGANPMQTIKAFEEAEKYPGPSIIIAYTPCISHGLKGGMGNTLDEAREAVNTGFWSLYRYNPQLASLGKSPMTLDFKRPEFDKMKDYFAKQVRFNGLKRVHPDIADEMYDKTVADAKRRFINYATLSGDLEKIQRRWDKAANVDEAASTLAVPRVKKERVKDPEAEARRAARRAARAAKKENKNE
ncbi:MAG: 4Fe-4S binding protein, partial [Streptococcaceae bacterium]|nr:4Fe-4S binding protein [Streptococcaceae bacterium]